MTKLPGTRSGLLPDVQRPAPRRRPCRRPGSCTALVVGPDRSRPGPSALSERNSPLRSLRLRSRASMRVMVGRRVPGAGHDPAVGVAASTTASVLVAVAQGDPVQLVGGDGRRRRPSRWPSRWCSCWWLALLQQADPQQDHQDHRQDQDVSVLDHRRHPPLAGRRRSRA